MLIISKAAGYINEIKHQRGKCTSETIDEGMKSCVSINNLRFIFKKLSVPFNYR